ncbi:MAG: GNAT family N-acetyltransferase [Clostridia bacterium]|nr:GNAT family N-acetyltransferase [Clostridia bacterium]
MDDAAAGQLIAAVTLEMRGGVYVLGDIAVKKEMRRKGYGAVLLQTVCREARQMGVRTLWVCAKEPDYFLHHGWQETDWDSALDIAVYCPVCAKYGVVCHPKKMKKTLDEM